MIGVSASHRSNNATVRRESIIIRHTVIISNRIESNGMEWNQQLNRRSNHNTVHNNIMITKNSDASQQTSKQNHQHFIIVYCTNIKGNQTRK